MRVFINDLEIPSTASAGATLGDVVEASRMHVDPSEILTIVEVDGIAFHAGDDHQYSRRSAAGVETLRIHTRSPFAFATDKRRDLAETLDTVAARTRLVVTLLRQSETRSANSLLASLMEELRLTLLLDYQLAMLAEDAPSAAARQEIAALAPQMLEAEEKKSWDALASLLDDALAPTLERWAASTRARLDAAA